MHFFESVFNIVKQIWKSFNCIWRLWRTWCLFCLIIYYEWMKDKIKVRVFSSVLFLFNSQRFNKKFDSICQRKIFKSKQEQSQRQFISPRFLNKFLLLLQDQGLEMRCQRFWFMNFAIAQIVKNIPFKITAQSFFQQQTRRISHFCL